MIEEEICPVFYGKNWTNYIMKMITPDMPTPIALPTPPITPDTDAIREF